MSFIKRIFHFVLAVWFAFVVFISFLSIYPLLHFALRSKKHYPFAQKTRKLCANFILFWGGIRVKQLVETPLDGNTPYVIASNHTSKLDMLTFLAKLELDVIFMADEAFSKIPLFGLFFKTIDIPVSLNDKRRSVLSYRKALQRLREQYNVVVFPEATISLITPTLSPFKNGVFRLAIEQQTDIVPVTLIKHWQLLPDDDIYYFSPGTVIQYVHRPISTKGMTLKDVEALKQHVFHIIANKLAEYGYKQ